MSEFKGTKGNYTACTDIANWYGFENRFYEVIDRDNAIIAFVKDWDGAGEQPKHDARLLAAAPELLASVMALLEDIEIENPLSYEDDINAARAAINKALGK